jgi:hypothetical protein
VESRYFVPSVQGATAAPDEVGVVEEHARPVLRLGRRTPGGLLAVDGVHLGVVLEAAPVVLPRLGGQLGRRVPGPGLVVGVGEEGAVRAAAVLGPAGDDPVAGGSEDAGPAGQQPGEVGADHVLVVGRVGELDPFTRKVERDLAGTGGGRLVHHDADLGTATHLRQRTRVGGKHPLGLAF